MLLCMRGQHWGLRVCLLQLLPLVQPQVSVRCTTDLIVEISGFCAADPWFLLLSPPQPCLSQTSRGPSDSSCWVAAATCNHLSTASMPAMRPLPAICHSSFYDSYSSCLSSAVALCFVADTSKSRLNGSKHGVTAYVQAAAGHAMSASLAAPYMDSSCQQSS